MVRDEEPAPLPTPPAAVRVFQVGRTDPPSLHEVADPETLDQVFKALANVTRRGILASLHDHGGWMRSTDVAHRSTSRGRGCHATCAS